MDLTLDLLRAKAARAIGWGLWLHVPLVVGIALLRGVSPLWPAIAVLVLAGLVQATAVHRPESTSGHVVLAFAYAAIIAIMVGQMNGHPWQIDMHMYFFAALAIVSALCSWPAILGFVAFVAVHHLALNFLLTEYVFGGASDLQRVLLHAVILVAEGVALGALTFVLAQMFARCATGVAAACTARAEAELLLEERSEAQAKLDGFVTLLINRITAIAEGEFDRPLAADAFPPEYDGVRRSVNWLCDRLNQALATVAEAADGIRNAETTLGAASQNLSEANSDQAATLTRAIQAFRALNGSLSSTAQMAQQADQVMIENRAEVEKGTVLLSEVVLAMGMIEQSTGQIRQIVEVMDNIAFQTNLLALNAGVEAARAGESGRGFAVVAMEVRALAQRAAESAREIRGLIDAGQGNVALGTQKVSLTTNALQSLMGSARKAAGIVSDIATQVKVQSQNLGDVQAEVVGLDGQSQRNAELASRIAGAGQELQRYSDDLARGMEELSGQDSRCDPTAFGQSGSWAA
ncbi:MAG: methyl-accepting chemotaxis protein [Cypionkella sp.]